MHHPAKFQCKIEMDYDSFLMIVAFLIQKDTSKSFENVSMPQLIELILIFIENETQISQLQFE